LFHHFFNRIDPHPTFFSTYQLLEQHNMSGLRQEIADALSAAVHRQSMVEQSVKDSDAEFQKARFQFERAVIKREEEKAAAQEELGHLNNYHKALGMPPYETAQALHH
jgi:hypothetical protein